MTNRSDFRGCAAGGLSENENVRRLRECIIYYESSEVVGHMFGGKL